MTPEQNRDLAAALRNLHTQVTRQAHQIELLTAANKRLASRNAELRARVTKLEAARDKWKARATGYRPTVNRLRSRVTDIRRSRDLWKHRALR